MKIPFIDVFHENSNQLSEIKSAINSVIDSGSYILGKELSKFESQVKKITNSKFCCGVGNGTDALILTLKYLNLNKEDEVITVSNSYLATVSSIVLAGATPVLCDVNELNGLISAESVKKSLTSKTKAIIVVHLGGYLAEIDKIRDICNDKNVALIEDCAQAFGTRDSKGQHVGTFGFSGCFSAHPLKNLAAFGDAGFITTNDEEFAIWLQMARNHGHISRNDIKFPSINSRLDEIHAATLNVQIKYFGENISIRRNNVLKYKNLLGDVVYFPEFSEINLSSHHLLIICLRNRDALIQSLLDKFGIELKIHYPRPYHLLSTNCKIQVHDNLSKTELRAETIVSLPIASHINDDVILKVTEEVKKYV